MKQVKVCLFPEVQGVGGMVSFRTRMVAGLQNRGIEVCQDPRDQSIQAVLVIGGTRHLGLLWRLRRRGVRIVQRLNGLNWLHRVSDTGLRHFLRAEYGNLILRFIRNNLADRVIYQSDFARGWWEREYGPPRVPNLIVYNGVELDQFKPDKHQPPPKGRWRILMVEGSMLGGYQLGLQHGLEMVLELARLQGLSYSRNVRSYEWMVVGRVSEEIKNELEEKRGRSEGGEKLVIRWMGQVQPERIPEIDRSAHILYSGDLNAACPNSVIEALACGTPVVAFDTGALSELVTEGAGSIVPYGGDPWKLDRPNISHLARGALEIIQHRTHYSLAARARAEQVFGADQMVEKYLEALLGT